MSIPEREGNFYPLSSEPLPETMQVRDFILQVSKAHQEGWVHEVVRAARVFLALSPTRFHLTHRVEREYLANWLQPYKELPPGKRAPFSGFQTVLEALIQGVMCDWSGKWLGESETPLRYLLWLIEPDTIQRWHVFRNRLRDLERL